MEKGNRSEKNLKRTKITSRTAICAAMGTGFVVRVE